jgi:hypothetical protein
VRRLPADIVLKRTKMATRMSGARTVGFLLDNRQGVL